jgi:hypothetical protein
MAGHPMGIGEVAIEREERILDLGIDRVMKALDRVDAGRDLAKRGIELRQVLEVDGNVPLAQLRWAKAQFAPCDAIGNQVSALLQPVEIGAGARGEFDVANARLEIEPDVVDVHPTPIADTARRRSPSR